MKAFDLYEKLAECYASPAYCPNSEIRVVAFSSLARTNLKGVEKARTRRPSIYKITDCGLDDNGRVYLEVK